MRDNTKNIRAKFVCGTLSLYLCKRVATFRHMDGYERDIKEKSIKMRIQFTGCTHFPPQKSVY